MTFADLYTQILAVCPEAVFGQDSSGELTISTGLILGKDGILTPIPKD